MPPATSVGDVVDAIENAGPLDSVAGALTKFWHRVARPQAVKDVLHGVPFGHPVHPALTDTTVGLWGASIVTDLVPGGAAASTALIAAGLCAFVPTALTGWTDWADLDQQQQRVGLVHAASTGTGAALFALSLSARIRGRGLRGRALSAAAITALSAGGYLGGHLVFRRGAGTDRTVDAVAQFPSGWHEVGNVADLVDGEFAVRSVAGVDLLVVRRGQAIDVLVNRCSHAGGPLDEGRFAVAAGEGCVVCPLHGSTFQLSDGAVIHGPATARQPRLESRVRGGRLDVRMPTAG